MRAQKIISAGLVLAGLAQASELRIDTHTAGDAGFAVNSHLIQGKRESILVDAQFTRSEAQKVADMVRRSGTELKTIFITHGHPDHYFGLETLTKEFPRAQVVATPEVIQDILATGQGKLKYWTGLYKDEMPQQLVIPNSIQGTALSLEGEALPILDLGPGESEHASVLYLPSVKTLVAGDLIYGGVHLWLAEERPEAWINNLKIVRTKVAAERVLSGHGRSGEMALFDENARYILDFGSIMRTAQTKEEALRRIQELYPNYRLPIIAELSIAASLK